MLDVGCEKHRIRRIIVRVQRCDGCGADPGLRKGSWAVAHRAKHFSLPGLPAANLPLGRKTGLGYSGYSQRAGPTFHPGAAPRVQRLAGGGGHRASPLTAGQAYRESKGPFSRCR